MFAMDLCGGVRHLVVSRLSALTESASTIIADQIRPIIDVAAADGSFQQWIYPWQRGKRYATRTGIDQTIHVVITTMVKCGSQDQQLMNTEMVEVAGIVDELETHLMRVENRCITIGQTVWTLNGIDDESPLKPFLDLEAADRNVFIDHVKLTYVRMI